MSLQKEQQEKDELAAEPTVPRKPPDSISDADSRTSSNAEVVCNGHRRALLFALFTQPNGVPGVCLSRDSVIIDWLATKPSLGCWYDNATCVPLTELS